MRALLLIAALLACGPGFACSSEEDPRQRCGPDAACLPGWICGAGGYCARVEPPDAGRSEPDAGTPAADAGPGGPPYRVHVQAQVPGAHFGQTDRHRLTGGISGGGAPAAEGQTDRYRLRGGVRAPR